MGYVLLKKYFSLTNRVTSTDMWNIIWYFVVMTRLSMHQDATKCKTPTAKAGNAKWCTATWMQLASHRAVPSTDKLQHLNMLCLPALISPWHSVDGKGNRPFSVLQGCRIISSFQTQTDANQLDQYQNSQGIPSMPWCISPLFVSKCQRHSISFMGDELHISLFFASWM